jgi:DNA-binding NarL/FixJ family response regulator
MRRLANLPGFGQKGTALQIIVADNQAIFRTGIARVLTPHDDLCVATICADLECLSSAIERLPKSIVIFPSSITSDLPALLACIEEANSRAVVIIEHEATLQQEVEDRMAGILLRSVAGPELIDCLHRVARGERSVQRASAKTEPAPDRTGANVLERLTPKELQIIALISEGCKNKEIATQLATKEQVVKNYLRTIFDKIGVSDRLELALFTVHHRVLAEAAERVRTTMVRSA